jgi:hypothetical protein
MNTRARALTTQRAPPAVPPTLGRSFLFLAASAALSRGAPFAVNVAVARRLTPTQLGVPTIHFALVRPQAATPRVAASQYERAACMSCAQRRCSVQVSTLVLTVREGFRRACLRHDSDDAAALAVGWLAVPTGALVAALVACAARVALGAAAMATPYGAALCLVCAAGACAHAALLLRLAAVLTGVVRFVA